MLDRENTYVVILKIPTQRTANVHKSNMFYGILSVFLEDHDIITMPCLMSEQNIYDPGDRTNG